MKRLFKGSASKPPSGRGAGTNKAAAGKLAGVPPRTLPDVSVPGLHDMVVPEEYDNVFVLLYGLDGDSVHSWRERYFSEEPGTLVAVSWPRQFLPSDLPRSRIFAFTYSFKNIDLSPREYGRSLLEALRYSWRNNHLNGLPIFFVAAGLGGLILSETLRLALESSTQEIRSIEESTLGIAFFDTPHHGTNGLDKYSGTELKGKIGEKGPIIAMERGSPEETLEVLRNMCSRGVLIINAFCGRQPEISKPWIIKNWFKPRAILDFEGERVVPMEIDEMSASKLNFSTRSEYRVILGMISEKLNFEHFSGTGAEKEITSESHNTQPGISENQSFQRGYEPAELDITTPTSQISTGFAELDTQSMRMDRSSAPFELDGSNSTAWANSAIEMDKIAVGNKVGLFVLGNGMWGLHNKIKLDIVAIHGLPGHYAGTWQAQNGKIWLRDFLTQPEVRVFSFGWVLPKSPQPTDASLKEIALEMLARVDTARQLLQSRDRPVVFVAHQIGGTIVQKAVVEAAKDPRFLHISKQISAIIFFATPHQGFNQDTLAMITARYGNGTNSIHPMVEGLARGSPTLPDIYSQFKRLENKLNVLNFYDSSRAAESMDQLTEPGCNTFMDVMVDRDMTPPYDICSFESAKDPYFELVQDTIAHLA